MSSRNNEILEQLQKQAFEVLKETPVDIQRESLEYMLKYAEFELFLTKTGDECHLSQSI